MVVTLGQQYNVGEKPTVVLYAYIINRDAGTPDKNKTKTFLVHNKIGLLIILRSRVSRPMAMTGHVDATWGGSFWRV